MISKIGVTTVAVVAAAVIAAAQSTTRVSIQDSNFLINGAVTHLGTPAEGLLLNSRMVHATFDDENSSTVGNWRYPDTGKWDAERNLNEFIVALPSYRAQGLRMVTINLQGGRTIYTGNNQPNITTAYTATGTLKAAWLSRLDRAIRACDQQGIVVILGLFYFGQDQRLFNEQAVVTGVDAVTDWLVQQGYTNVLVEIANEANGPYDHDILKSVSRAPELIKRVQQRSGGKLKVTTSYGGGHIPPASVITASDYVLLHGNAQSAGGIASMVDEVRATAAYRATPKPIVFNEDGRSTANLDAAVTTGASWGYFDQPGFQTPPINWTINTSAKQTFFNRVAFWTNASTEPPPPPQEQCGNGLDDNGDGQVDEGCPTTPPPTGQSIVSVTLINADTNQPISGFDPITQGAVLDLSTLPTRRLNLKVNTNPATVGSVRCVVNGQVTRTESAGPYACFGDSRGNYNAWTPAAGAYTLVTTPYSGASGSGTAGTSFTLKFSVTD